MKNSFPQQLIPLGILFVIALAGLLLARYFLVPPTFGEIGHYRAASIAENAAHEVVYAGQGACFDCHDDVVELKSRSNHQGVSCEVCHGPGAQHIEDPTEITPEAPRKRGFCPLCHGFDPARPSGFPQILPVMHNPGQPCISCHDPHNPLLPHAPEECSACHRDIANKKTVSHHASVPCRTCHEVSPEHLVNPRFAAAQKPREKAVCGQCHAEDAESSAEIPRISLEDHGGRYLCWECHYPHYPEAN
jgi:hypothetical protein